MLESKIFLIPFFCWANIESVISVCETPTYILLEIIRRERKIAIFREKKGSFYFREKEEKRRKLLKPKREII